MILQNNDYYTLHTKEGVVSVLKNNNMDTTDWKEQQSNILKTLF